MITRIITYQIKKKGVCVKRIIGLKFIFIIIKDRLSEWKSNSKIKALVIAKIAKSKSLRKKIYMTKKLINKNTTNLKFNNIANSNFENFSFANFAKFENFTSESIVTSIVVVLTVLKTCDIVDEYSAFPVSTNHFTKAYTLKNCWILNCDINIHVCNDRTRFELFRTIDSNDRVCTDKIIYAIEGYDIVDVLIDELNKSVLIKLLNVTLASNFWMKLMCLSKFIAKEVYWHTEFNRVQVNESTFCYIESMSEYWVVENNLSDHVD